MATATFVHEGRHIDHTPSSALAAGDVVQLTTDNMLGIALSPIAANKQGALAIEGVFEFTKAQATDVMTVGETVVYSAGTVDEGTGPHRVTEASGNGVAKVKVKINVGLVATQAS